MKDAVGYNEVFECNMGPDNLGRPRSPLRAHLGPRLRQYIQMKARLGDPNGCQTFWAQWACWPKPLGLQT